MYFTNLMQIIILINTYDDKPRGCLAQILESSLVETSTHITSRFIVI